MKKNFKILALPALAAVFAISLASCSDQYAGNYQEANEEQITSFQQKVSDAEAYEAQNNSNLEITADVSGNVSAEGQSASMSMKYSMVNDFSDETKTLTYTNCNFSMSISGVSMTMKFDMWTDDTTAYLSYEEGMAGYTQKEKVKGSISSLSSYTSIIDAYKNMAEKYDLQTVVEQLNKSGAKIYVDGDNKLKLEFTEQNVQVYIYVIFNADNTYSMKVDMPEFNYSTSGIGMKMKMTVEIKPTGKTVTLPNASDFTQA